MRLSEAAIKRLVRDARVARLATVGPDGRPHIVPFVFAVEGETLYSEVDAKPKTSPNLRRIENMRANPAVSVLVDHYEENWSRLWWARIDGRGRILEDGTERERALQLLAQKYEQYNDMPPAGAVIAIDVSRWLGWSASPIE